ncbi:S-adenosyl-L-methionine-dependent methyltransferase [Pelagophyceae sp. CCMP2097]|nr:S-adenosyl-L-methionine-dependent methyltransferase [Pelagophyceae sp. CCMP2097]|mmetsp:Transcript_30071/g.101379  ORF Transcript_30071/g.101379 Transcript_30071/m.101379 type:complete len:314 (-) Transcript_30071:210-1151(-)
MSVHMTSSTWFKEEETPDQTMAMRLKSMTFDGQSDFQRVQVIETFSFGKTLVLDGKTQSAAGDEAIYHESLVHPSLLKHPNPKRIFIGGGGELATAREVLRHKSVETVVMVDLDKSVVDTCRQWLPEWNCGSTEDPRLELIYGDAKLYLEEYPADAPRFDVIIMDICDPIEGGPGVHLYMREFYDLLKTRLGAGGIVLTQAGPADVFNHKECFTAIHKTMEQSYAHVSGYSVSIPSFGSAWGFLMAYDDETVAPKNESIEVIDKKVSERLSRLPLKHYDGESHVGMFHLQKVIRDGIAKETRIITKETPVFMY